TALLISVDARPAASPAARARNPWASLAHDWLDGLRLVWHERTLRLMFAFMAISAVGEGVMGSLFAPFVLRILHGGELGFGGLVSAQAIGGLVGSFALAARPNVLAPARLIGFGALGPAVFDLLTFNYHRIVPGLV